MITGNLQPPISLNTKDANPSHHLLSLHKYPPNNGTKMHEKMDIVYEESDDEKMEDENMTSSSTTPMRSLARLLVAKLKAIMKTNTTAPPTEVMMDIDNEEQKKQA